MQKDAPISRLGSVALALAVTSSLLYFLFSDGFLYLLQALVSAGRNLIVVG